MSKYDEDKIYTSAELSKELNEERRKQGLSEMPAINSFKGGTSTIARKDKSWGSVPDFFVKMFKKK